LLEAFCNGFYLSGCEELNYLSGGVMQRKDSDGHIIEATATQDAETARWTVHVVVSWERGTDLTFQPLEGPPEGFATEAEAEAWGVALGQKWIDDGKPSPP
jgi:hypothetical protein